MARPVPPSPAHRQTSTNRGEGAPGFVPGFDLSGALAGATDMNQALQIILVSLRDLLPYDRAGWFLLDEHKGYVLAEKAKPGQESAPKSFLGYDPIIDALGQTQRPIYVEDIQNDGRFAGWPDMQSIHGWLGAPLFAGKEMIGFISLGSLQAGAYGESEAASIHAFTRQASEMLERTWLHEQTHRRTEELEILSTISIALGQAETRENILAAIMDQLRHFFEASAGAFFFPDQSGAQLVIKHSLDSSQVGLAYPQGDEPLWQVFQTAQPVVIRDASAFVRQNRQQVYRLLFHAVQSAVLLPLKAGEGSFGVLFLGYAERRHFTSQDLHLYQTIAEITGTSLRRAVMLEALEQQASVRTQHLSTLYSINAVTGKALDLTSILEQVLRITVEAMNGRAGLVHLISENGCEIVLAAQHNLSSETALRARAIRLDKAFWQDLVLSSNPLIVLDPRNEPRLPGALRQVLGDRPEAYLGALIKAMGQPLGLLSVFGAPSPGSTLEETTLFLTIADQLGTSVERARLVAQAEKAAVIQERQRLARELHDSVTQLLYSLVLFAGAGRKVMGQGNQDLLDEYLHRINQAALQALKEMRLLVYELRPTDYLEEGLVSALRRRLDAVEKRTGINALLTVEGELNLDEATEMALYRITQEALNNTLKHSGASQVSVDLRAHQGKVTLAITDNGSGFSLADKFTTGGLGISSIQERVAALGGQLEILSQPGQGAQISVTIEEAK